MPRSAAHIFNTLSEGLFLAVLFLVPIIALPWTTDAFETNKQVVLVLGTTLSAACYMVATLLEHRSMTRPGLLALMPLLILLATAISAAASLAPMTSWMGQGAQEYASVLSLVGLLAAFFLAKTFLKVKRMAVLLRLTLFASSAIVGLALVPIFFGLHAGVFTNLVGTPHACAIYLLILSIFACGQWLVGYQPESVWARRGLQVTTIITFVACLTVLLALDSVVIWTLALVGTVALFVFALIHADKFQDSIRFTPIMILFVLSAIFLVLPTHFPSPFFQEVAPNLETTWNVVNGAWNEGSVAFGTGPGTFPLVYTKYTALAVNQSDFWELVFDRGNAYVTTQLAAIGLVGVLAWLFFSIMCLVLATKQLLSTQAGWRETLPAFAAWLVLFVAAFVYTENLTLALLFWVLSAALAEVPGSVVSSKASHQARARLATVLVAVLVLVCAVTTMFVTVPRYFAEVAFAKAVKNNAQADTAEEVDELISRLDKAAAANPWNDSYYRNLAGALLKRVSLLSSDEAADNDYVQSLITSAISAATKATDLSPANVANWDVRGFVYRELLSVVPDAVQPSIDAYEKAIELAPTNPRYRVEVARVYLALADLQTPYLDNDDQGVADQSKATQEAAYNHAEDHLLTAIALKSDYAPAQYYLALLRERQGELAEAVRGLELVKVQSPNDVGVGLELGLLYLRQGKNELAQAELQRVIALAPAYANAHWYLSVVFEQKGDLPSAIAEVEKVLETNPDNVTVETRLDRLKAGQTSDVIPDPVTTTTL